MNVLIIGYGVVGTNLCKELAVLKPDVYDKYKGIDTRAKDKYDFGFVCVDTPLKKDGTLDVEEVNNVFEENDCDIYVLKSTCPVGTVETLGKKDRQKVIFSPEYYGGTQHCNNFDFNFTILGGDKDTCYKVIQLLQSVYDARHVFKVVEPKVAEMAKFMENSFLAMKVSFCNEFFDSCEKEGIAYEEVRECFILDPRVNASHTFVYKEHPYYDSHCLNKDVPQVANAYDMKLLKKMIELNEIRKNHKKY